LIAASRLFQVGISIGFTLSPIILLNMSAHFILDASLSSITFFTWVLCITVDGAQCDACVKQECSATPAPTPSPCEHGGTVNGATGKCVNCAGAWYGDRCQQFNATMPIAAQVQAVVAVASQDQSLLDSEEVRMRRHSVAQCSSHLLHFCTALCFAQTQYNPLCKQHKSQCAGWGVDAQFGATPFICRVSCLIAPHFF
jgi:hypothetical protein